MIETKYVKVVNQLSKQCLVGLGQDENYYKSLGFEKREVEKAYDGIYYLAGFVPKKPQELVNKEKIFNLKKNLSYTDYKAIKYAEGLISEEEYAEIKAQRQAWRDEINELEKELSEKLQLYFLKFFIKLYKRSLYERGY